MKISLKWITLRYFVIKYFIVFQIVRQYRQRSKLSDFFTDLEKKKVNSLVDVYKKFK